MSKYPFSPSARHRKMRITNRNFENRNAEFCISHTCLVPINHKLFFYLFFQLLIKGYQPLKCNLYTAIRKQFGYFCGAPC